MFDNTLAFDLKLSDTCREQVWFQAFHDPTLTAHKMRVFRVMARLAHAIPEGPISSRKALDQAPVHQKVKDAIKGDLIDGHLVSDGCYNLDGRQGSRLLPNGPENRLTKGGRVHAMTFEHFRVVTTFAHVFYNNVYATELQAQKTLRAIFRLC